MSVLEKRRHHHGPLQTTTDHHNMGIVSVSNCRSSVNGCGSVAGMDKGQRVKHGRWVKIMKVDCLSLGMSQTGNNLLRTSSPH